MTMKPQRLYQVFAEQIAGFIEQENLQPGDKLPGELALARQFGVSRTTVREALLGLEIAGSIEIRGGSGTYLKEPSARPRLMMDAGPGPFELLNARVLVEGEIAAEAALLASKDDLERIEASIRAMRGLAAKGENAQAADREFHLRIAEAAKNAVLASFVDVLWSGIFSPMFHKLSQRVGLQHHQQMTLDDHSLILQALKQRDAQAARSAMRLHLRHVQDVLQGDNEPGVETSLKRRRRIRNRTSL